MQTIRIGTLLALFTGPISLLAQGPTVPPSQNIPQVRTAVPTVAGYQPYALSQSRADRIAPELRRMLNDLVGSADVQIDAVNNRIFVGGNPQIQQMAAQLIQNLDRPAAKQPPALPITQQPKTAAVVKGYAVPVQQLPYWINHLRQQYPLNTGVRVATDQRTGQLLVIAPEAIQSVIQRQLLGTNLAQPQSGLVTQPAQQPQPASPPDYTSASHQLQNINWLQFEKMLRQLWGDRLLLSSHENGQKSVVQMPETGDRRPVMQIDRQRGQLSIAGPKPMTEAWVQVAQALDAPANSPRKNLQLVPVKRADPDTVRKAVRLIDNAARAASQKNTTADAIRLHPRDGERRWGGDLITSIFQPAVQKEAPAAPQQQPAATPNKQPPETPQKQPPADPTKQPAPPAGEQPDPAAGIIATTTEDTGAIGPVRIEFVESLGVFIVSGNKRDVERVTAIIEEIESSVRDTQPEIVVYTLAHVNNRALSDLIAQIYTTVFGSWQSPVSITPLDKPNALLLIGRQESIDSVLNLIRKLDQPVPPSTQLKVFRLQHMSAIDAERQLQAFYGGATTGQQNQGTDARIGLGPRIRVIADYRTNSVIVNASPRDLAEIKLFLERIDVEETVATNQIKVFRLKNALADDLQPVLQEAITGQGAGQATPGGQAGGAGGTTSSTVAAQSSRLSILRIGEDGQTELNSGILAGVSVTSDANVNALIVRAPAKSMALIAELITQLDQLPNAEAQIKVFQLENADATNLTIMLQTLFGQQATAGQTGNAQSFAQNFAQAGTAGGETSLIPLRFAVDVRTNSIIVSGSMTDLRVVETLLLRLDEADIEARQTQVFRLNNAPAAEVATAITNFLNSQRQLIQQQLQFSQLVSPFEQINREVIVVAESVSNSLIVSATPRYFEDIVKVINDLDFRPKMVMVQVLIAEVELTDNFEFGVELGLQDSLLFDRGLASVGFPFAGQPLGNDLPGTFPASLATRSNLAGQAASTFAMGRTSAGLGYGGMVLSAANESVNVMIRALQDAGRIHILSRPQIMTLDNQEAFVQVGARVPRITGSTITQFGGTQNTTADEDVGLLLTIRPRVSPDGLVVMEISTEKSEVGPIEQGIPVAVTADGNAVRSPLILTTTAQTVVSAQSGQTVVFAGLMTKTQSDSNRSVPYLSDLPLIGPAFRFKANEERRTELLIIMTPQVINGEEDLDRIKTVESERMSWVLSDAIEIHGDVGLSGGGGRSTIIYPDTNPTGRGDSASENDSSSRSERSSNNPWKRLFRGFNNDDDDDDDTPATQTASGPRPEPSGTRSSQSNTTNQSRQPLGTPQPAPTTTSTLYPPPAYPSTTLPAAAPYSSASPVYYQATGHPPNQPVSQPYPSNGQQPVPAAYAPGRNPYPYQPAPAINPAQTANPNPPTPYGPAGYPLR